MNKVIVSDKIRRIRAESRASTRAMAGVIRSSATRQGVGVLTMGPSIGVSRLRGALLWTGRKIYVADAIRAHQRFDIDLETMFAESSAS
jgi:hypothetical protein